ncbi:OsmC family protein [Ornithinimicrobium kibberense]|jgi:osmotically inducible protein OsmC|uniref:OsmC family protein n=1 Tax=Ornithinimicrobium kibberense TaxID=282060 RepID=A0ABV5V4L9_9MICO|nr:OsmC family protein [Ornithinimicrobium kibberense]
MALTSKASTTWTGNLPDGSGRTSLDSSGQGTFDVSWQARAEAHGGTTNPEELIAAAHASCYSMAFAGALGKNGTPPTQLDTTAEVTFDPTGPAITGIHLTVRASVEGLDESDFQRMAEGAKEGCPVSKALAGTEITLTAELA